MLIKSSVASIPTDERLGYLLKRVQQALTAEMSLSLRSLDITVPQYAALAMLEQYPGLSNADLADKCFVTPQTMHQIILRLQQRSLISRQPHPNHGRIQQTRLTPEGTRVLQQAQVEVHEVEARMVQLLTEDERQHAARLLRMCLTALQKPD